MEKQMNVAVMDRPGHITMQQRPIPQPGRGEVLVQLEYIGICGSDLHYYEAGRIGGFVVEYPFVLGHEAAGTVAALGEGVTHLQMGDRVALEPGKTCGHCEFCKTGRYNLCPDVEFFATPPVDGVFQEYVAHEAALCFKLPDNVSTMEGALIEPLAIGFYAAQAAGAAPGQTVVVSGAGCIGLVSLLALKAMGVSRVIVTDILPGRLEKAMELGAYKVLNAAECDVAKEVQALTGTGCDTVIETSGNQSSVGNSIKMCKPGGMVVLVGYSPDGMMNLPVGTALDHEITLKPIFRYRHMYPATIDAVASGRVDVKSIVSDVFGLDDAEHAMQQSLQNKACIVKSVLRVGDA